MDRGWFRGPQQVGMSRLYTQQTLEGKRATQAWTPSPLGTRCPHPLRQGSRFKRTLRPSPQVSGAPERAPEYLSKAPLALDT